MVSFRSCILISKSEIIFSFLLNSFSKPFRRDNLYSNSIIRLSFFLLSSETVIDILESNSLSFLNISDLQFSWIIAILLSNSVIINSLLLNSS